MKRNPELARDGTEPELGLRDGAKPLVGGQLSDLCDVILLDGALYDCLEHSLKLKPQVSKKRIKLFSNMAAHNSLS